MKRIYLRTSIYEKTQMKNAAKDKGYTLSSYLKALAKLDNEKNLLPKK